MSFWSFMKKLLRFVKWVLISATNQKKLNENALINLKRINLIRKIIIIIFDVIEESVLFNFIRRWIEILGKCRLDEKMCWIMKANSKWNFRQINPNIIICSRKAAFGKTRKKLGKSFLFLVGYCFSNNGENLLESN